MYKVNARLKPARNVARCRPRVCANCKHFQDDDGFGYCERPKYGDHTRPSITMDATDMWQFYTTCDSWREDTL